MSLTEEDIKGSRQNAGKNKIRGKGVRTYKVGCGVYFFLMKYCPGDVLHHTDCVRIYSFVHLLQPVFCASLRLDEMTLESWKLAHHIILLFYDTRRYAYTCAYAFPSVPVSTVQTHIALTMLHNDSHIAGQWGWTGRFSELNLDNAEGVAFDWIRRAQHELDKLRRWNNKTHHQVGSQCAGTGVHLWHFCGCGWEITKLRRKKWRE